MKKKKLKRKISDLKRQLKAWKAVRKSVEVTWYYRKGK